MNLIGGGAESLKLNFQLINYDEVEKLVVL